MYGARGRTRTGTRVKSRGILSPLCLPISPPGQKIILWSGKRGSNSRPQPWQGCALPLSYSRKIFKFFHKIRSLIFCGARGRTRTGTRVKSRGILSPLCLPISPPGRWRLRPESNRRPRLCRPLHNHFATQPH